MAKRKVAPLKEQVATSLKEARKEMKITQQELADRLGVSTRYIKELESGRLNPSLDAVEKYCFALNVRVDIKVE